MATKKKGKKTRTVLRSSTGTKLYAVRNADGTFNDIQSYKRAHAQDLARTSKAEAAKSGSASRSKAKSKAKRKTAARKK
jgi:vacuolar-type H+-ATPase subunit E/Vma4